MEFPNHAHKREEDTAREEPQMDMSVAGDGDVVEDVVGGMAGDKGVGLETTMYVEVSFTITMALMDLIFVESLSGLRPKSMI